MEAYTNCREFNCVTPIMEQSEYHMFCRERAELYLPEMYNKIGVGLMAWGPLGMYLTENTERLFFSKGSLRSKTQNSSWTEDEVAKEVSCCSNDLIKTFNHFRTIIIPAAKDRVEEAKRHLERVRDLNLLAEKLGCSVTQLSIAWTLKHEPVQCLLISAKTTEQLTQSLQALQVSWTKPFRVNFWYAAYWFVCGAHLIIKLFMSPFRSYFRDCPSPWCSR